MASIVVVEIACDWPAAGDDCYAMLQWIRDDSTAFARNHDETGTS
jgi:acetyl esterase/lipase